jgi:phosphate transport system substrate-binding protein
MKEPVYSPKASSLGKSIFIVIVTLALSCAYRPDSSPKIIRIKGSDTMLILTERWAESYMTTHPGISIYAEGGGSATGIQALINGKIDICAASRPLNSDEVKPLAEKYGNIGISFLVAKDALSIYVNPANPVKDITLKQAKEIFSGKIRNWKLVGGNNEEIKVFIRPPTSGTHLYLKEHILEGDEYGANAIPIPTTAAIVDSVFNNPNAIGYGGIAYGSKVIHCQINGIHPSKENVRYDLYPISRYLYFYTIKKPQGEVKRFIDWVIGARGQEIVEEVGYIPLWTKQ